MISKFINALFFVITLTISTSLTGQDVDHWETVVYNQDAWRYAVGSSDIGPDWVEPDFEDSDWLTGRGGFGYGDDDELTVLEDIFSVFLRKEFEVSDLDLIDAALLHADFDDGFVAYLNGVEIARANLGEVGAPVAYDVPATDYTEARLFRELLPNAFRVHKDILREGSNTLAIQVHNSGSNSSDLSANFFLSVGINDESMTYADTPPWFDKSVFNSNLPIIKIKTGIQDEIIDDPRIIAEMGIISNENGMVNSQLDPFNNYDGLISIELRGTSSLEFAKKGYSLETQNADGSNNNVELLGLPSENDWILNGPYADKSLLRNDLTYHLGELTGQYAPRTRLCEVCINDNYEGIYVLTEKIKQDKNRVDIAKLTLDDNTGDELTGGYIIKVDRNDQNIPNIGWVSEFPDNKFFAYVEPKSDVITEAQRNYIQDYMDEFESAMFENNYEETYLDYIDVQSFVDYFIVTEIGKHIDAYKLSFYMYKKQDSKGGKLHFGPLWDFNLGYGNFDFACSPDPAGWSYEFPDCGSWHPFWARRIADIPNIQHRINCRWSELRAGLFNSESLALYIDQKELEMGAAVNRNFDRWPVLGTYIWPNNFVGATYAEELEFLKNWLQQRLEWMDDNMVGDCNQYVSAIIDSDEEEVIKLFPNPNQGTFRLKNINESAFINVYNSQNKLVLTQEVQANDSSTINNLPSGFYILHIRSQESLELLYSTKVVVVE